jgi:hypothetical protein
VIENPYYEAKRYKFSEKVVNAQDNDEQDDERPSTPTVDDVARRLDSHIEDVSLRFDDLTRLVEKIANTCHSK